MVNEELESIHTKNRRIDNLYTNQGMSTRTARIASERKHTYALFPVTLTHHMIISLLRFFEDLTSFLKVIGTVLKIGRS